MSTPFDDEPDLAFGETWVPNPTTMIVAGFFTRSVLTMNGLSAAAKGKVGRGKAGVEGTVTVRVGGRWNHGGPTEVTLMLSPDGARDMARDLIEAANAADEDVVTWQRQQRGGG